MIKLVYIYFNVNNYNLCLVNKAYFNLIVLTYLAELSSFIPIIPLLYLDFHVNNDNLCLL